jgi:hypothetical protein
MILVYIDLGTGNVIIQLVVAGIASTVAYSKQLRTFLVGYLQDKFKKKRDN